MDLYYIILVLFLLVLILITSTLEKKSVGYFIIIIFLALTLQKCLRDNKKKELFTSETDTSEATDKLMEAAAKDKAINALHKHVEGLEKDIKDLTDIVRLKTINIAMEKNSKAENFDLTTSQKKQDGELASLEKELDVLLKLYRKETENNDKTKYHSLPIHSSCKTQEEGMQYIREYGNDNNSIQMLENAELMKNLGINSKSSSDLLTQMNKGGMSDNINFNINMV